MKQFIRTHKDPLLTEQIRTFGYKYYGFYVAIIQHLIQKGGQSTLQAITGDIGTQECLTCVELLVIAKEFKKEDTIISFPSLVTWSKRQEEIKMNRSKAGSKGMKSRWKSNKITNVTGITSDTDVTSVKEEITSDTKNEMDGNADIPLVGKGLQRNEQKNHGKKNVTSDIKDEGQVALINNLTINSKDIIIGNIKKRGLEQDHQKNMKKNFPSEESKAVELCEQLYYTWMEERGTPCVFTVANRKAMNTLVRFFIGISKKRQESPVNISDTVLNMWKAVLDHHSFWGKWEQGRVRLVDISSNITNIINAIKNGKNGNSNAAKTIIALANIKDF